MEQSSGLMPLLTLCVAGADKSRINRRFPGCERLGITHKWLTYTARRSCDENGPGTRPACSSLVRNS